MSDKQTASNWKRWVIGAVVTVVAVIGVVGGAYWALADLWDSASPEKAEFAAYLIGVALLVCQIVVSGFRAVATDKTARAMQQTAASTEKGNVAERFKNAVEHLGHKSVSVRLGGIYALHHIANENASYRERVFEILCAHVRETTTNENYAHGPPVMQGSKQSPSIEIESILHLLFVSDSGKDIYKEIFAQLPLVNLEGAMLSAANLKGANLHFSNLQHAFLEKAQLARTMLFGATINHAVMQGANMRSAHLGNAKLRDIDFAGADFSGAVLVNTDCQGCLFTFAKGLTAKQLVGASSLYRAVLQPDLEDELRKLKPSLFEVR